jgi:hypothetical protein
MSAGTQRLQAQLDATETFIDVWSSSDLLDDIGPTLTCQEADVLAMLLRVFDNEHAAEVLINAHRRSDTDPEDLHYAPDFDADNQFDE